MIGNFSDDYFVKEYTLCQQAYIFTGAASAMALKNELPSQKQAG